MTLSDLYPRGTKLVDVPPNFHGMPLRRWLTLKIVSQCEQEVTRLDLSVGPLTEAAEMDWKECKGREWRGERVHGPRDNYGILGI